MELLIGAFIVLILAIWAYLKSPKVRGARGEAKVNRRLSLFLPSGSYKIFNDVTLPTGGSSTQIDHIVVSPFGVFVIETKNYSGWIFGSEKSKNWTQVLYKKKYRLFNPSTFGSGRTFAGPLGRGKFTESTRSGLSANPLNRPPSGRI